LFICKKEGKTFMIKKIGILTSGGDAPGMNAAVIAVVKTAFSKNITPFLINDGYKGLIEDWINEVKPGDEGITQMLSRGGTFIGSARLPEFKEESVREKAVANLKKHGIEALVVIGGDGSYQGAEKLTQMGINCVGLPGTIDNDIVSSDYTIGFDTALNTVVDSIDKIRDTMQSHNRCSVVEIMGNGCGDLTLYAAVATGAEVFSTRESQLTEDEICAQVKALATKEKRSVVVAISENIYDAHALAKKIEAASGYVTRATVLGHVQRGGVPTGMDRYLATTAGIFAVEQLAAGIGGVYVGLDKGKLVARDIEATLGMPRPDQSEIYEKIRKNNSSY
jgi:6-phosphofructokinase 1